ncbi:MAG: NAD-dependent epimerase/dehydratase family protein, partial [Candidatus Acidiferrum sp.]
SREAGQMGREAAPMKALVTGGGGFLGGAIAGMLRARGDAVWSFSRGRYAALNKLDVEQVQGDLADDKAVESAMMGCDVVFHVAAKASLSGSLGEFQRTNVLGTEHVIQSCRRQNVRRLVYTSSPSVVFNGRDMEGVDESIPYPRHYEADYPKSKALAEMAVLRVNGPALATVALRPHLIWGPGDTNLMPRILARARAGRLRRIGKANKLIDSIYIDNAAQAHLLAADRLYPGAPIAGKAYFLSNGEPMPIWDLINRILACADVPPVTRSVPVWLAIALGGALESTYRLLGRSDEPPMTRFLARELSTAHWFDISAARGAFGYEPKITIEEGLRRLRDHLRNSSHPSDTAVNRV